MADNEKNKQQQPQSQEKKHDEEMEKKFTPVSQSAEQKKNSGRPGGGAGRVEDVSGSGVYPASGPLPQDNAPYQGEASFGQGKRGEAGYYDSGDSEILSEGAAKDLGGANQQTSRASQEEQEAAKRSNEKEDERIKKNKK